MWTSEDLALMQEDQGAAVCAWCGESAAGVLQAVRARTMVRVWHALVHEGLQPERVARVYAALLHEFAPAAAVALAVPFEMVSRSWVAVLMEGCESGVCEHCELDASAVEAAALRESVRHVLLEPLRYGAGPLDVAKTMMVRMKELRPELVRCATGESLGALLGYKEGARRAGVSAATRRVLNVQVESATGHAARFGRQKTPSMRAACARAQQGNGNRRAGVIKAMVTRILAKQ